MLVRTYEQPSYHLIKKKLFQLLSLIRQANLPHCHPSLCIPFSLSLSFAPSLKSMFLDNVYEGRKEEGPDSWF